MLFQVNYNEHEEQFFRSVMDAVENNLAVEQTPVEVPINIDIDDEVKDVGAKHRACSVKRGIFHLN